MAPASDTPTLMLTPVEIDSIVQSASASSVAPTDADSMRTVESCRLALGSSSLAAGAVERPAVPAASEPVAISPAASEPVANASATDSSVATRARSPIDLRGPRRTRETLRADAIRGALPPANRKR